MFNEWLSNFIVLAVIVAIGYILYKFQRKGKRAGIKRRRYTREDYYHDNDLDKDGDGLIAADQEESYDFGDDD